MGEVFGILLTIGVISYICWLIYHYLKENFPLIWFFIYFGGTIVVVLWFARYGVIGNISHKIMEPFILFLIAPFFGRFLGFFGLILS